MILIGIDPHKSSHTAVAVDATGRRVAQRRFPVNAGTFGQLMRCCWHWPEHRFAVEGARGLGRALASSWPPPARSWSRALHPVARPSPCDPGCDQPV